MPKISPFLWFATEAEQAANFYVGIFPNSKILSVSRYGDAGPAPAGSVMTVSFELDGKAFTTLNGGTPPAFTEAVSFVVDCGDQAEIDHYWNSLVEGGKPIMCGWLQDRYGLRWQITPRRLMELMSDPDKAKATRVMSAMMKMVKIDIAILEEAAKG